MIVQVKMKDPDTMYDAVQDAVIKEVNALRLSTGMPMDEAEELIKIRAEKVRAKMSKWFEYGEYLDVEFDTETMTAKVLDAGAIA